jgi:ATP-dependent exoDNAse (exonuclease V) alpha subunit
MLSAEQRNAVNECRKRKLVLITGPPGSGKTRLLAELAKDPDVFFLAPTGTSSDRVAQSTGKSARVVDYVVVHAKMDGKSPLEGKRLVVDEAGMLSTDLLQDVVDFIKPKSLALVGDPDQLPCPSGFSALSTLLHDARVHRVALTRVYRRAQTQSGLSLVLEDLRARRAVDPLTRQDDSFTVVLKPSMQECYDQVARMYAEKPRQILAYTNAAVNEINARTERADAKRVKGSARVGDRVVCTKNLYVDSALRVSNGTCGSLGASSVKYDNGYLDRELKSAFAPCRCMTIHKAQGNEYDAPGVVLLAPWKNGAPPLELLYTALSRFKTAVVVVATPALFKSAFQAQFRPSVDIDLVIP